MVIPPWFVNLTSDGENGYFPLICKFNKWGGKWLFPPYYGMMFNKLHFENYETRTNIQKHTSSINTFQLKFHIAVTFDSNYTLCILCSISYLSLNRTTFICVTWAVKTWKIYLLFPTFAYSFFLQFMNYFKLENCMTSKKIVVKKLERKE